jgi:DUF4097 and DUF4098 domain-containing protein YvlB
MVKKAKYFMLILLLAFSFLAAADYEQKIVRTFDLPAGGAVELANINGEITVSTGGTAVEITAVKRSDKKGEIEAVDVLFERSGDSLQVKTRYNKNNSRAKVDFTVSLPQALARAEFKSVNGRVKSEGKFTSLTLKTVNGKIDFRGEFASGVFKTVNGGIEVSQEPLLGGDLLAETVNGAISIELNRKSAFDAAGQTVNGSIKNDFGIEVQRHLVGRSMSGSVNGGGHRVKVETVNGSIEISKI